MLHSEENGVASKATTRHTTATASPLHGPLLRALPGAKKERCSLQLSRGARSSRWVTTRVLPTGLVTQSQTTRATQLAV